MSSDLERAQKLADGFASVDWVRVLGRYARRVNPLLRDLLAPMQYYWVTAQAEYSTDVLFRSHQALAGVDAAAAHLQHAVFRGA